MSVSSTITLQWEASFYRPEYQRNNNSPDITNKTKSAIFENENIIFNLSATIDSTFRKIDFFLNITDKFENKKKTIENLQYCVWGNFERKPNFENFDKSDLQFGVKYKLTDWANLPQISLFGSSDRNSNYQSNIIEVKITFQDDETLNCFKTWNSSSLEITPVNHSTLFCQKLVKFRNDSALFDKTILTSDEKEFKVHSTILALHSPVFAAMFANKNLFENEQKKVVIEDIDSQVIEALIAYIYGQEYTGWKTIAGELAKAADKYDIQPLKDACIAAMTADITVEVAAKNFYYAHLLELKDTMREVAEFISKHKKEVMATVDWKTLIKPNFNLLEILFELS